jgi:hypothetical protein
MSSEVEETLRRIQSHRGVKGAAPASRPIQNLRGD